MMLDKIYNNKTENGAPCYESTEALASYKLKTVLRHLNMSTFDYDIPADTIYIRKNAALLQDFTDHWFEDGGDYYFFENVTVRLKELVRNSFVDVTRQEIDKVRHNTSGDMITFDAPIIYKNGNTKWANFTLDTVLDEEGNPTHAIGYCKDIHEQKKELYRLRNIAQTDSLTGFRNRVGGIFKIQTRLSEDVNDTFFLAVIDLDKFKEANDLFGHSFGDLILKNVAERIRTYFEHETICCRTGGDEFLFFRKCENFLEAKKLLTELRSHIKHTVSYQGMQFDVSCSIGFSMSPSQGNTFDELFNKADAAMYYAKNNKVDGPVLYKDSMSGVRK